jgi:hypothetical protein
MKLMKTVAAATILLATTSGAAWAQSIAQAGVTVGATVFGPQGNEVGKVERIDGEVVTVNTGKNAAALGGNSFVKGPNGPVIGFTKAQLDDAVEAAAKQAQAKLEAALVAGAALRTSDGIDAGVIKSLNDDGSVVIEQPTRSFALQRDLFTTDDKGLVLRITALQLNNALATTPAPTSAG